jgi:hypothetical protein
MTTTREWVVISLGKIVQFDGKQYGVCYVTYDAAFADGRGGGGGADGEEEEDTRVFKRGFTLPDLTLLRCNLFATVLAVEFAAGIVKRGGSGDGGKCVIAVKHRGAYDLATDVEAIAAASDPSLPTRRWPRRLARNAALLRRLIRSVRKCGGAVELSPVDPGRNVDGDLEFYANCDRDPLEHQDDERLPEGSEEFQELMRVAREHKRSANDLAEVGRVFPRTRMRKPTKKESTYAATGTGSGSGGSSSGGANATRQKAPVTATTSPPPTHPDPQSRRGSRKGAVSDAEFDALVKAFLGDAKTVAPSAQK